ncbi:MAG: hypothetical protein IJJ50_09285 [Lachnospiraceae bacterium]|nr:hypothetical protein [Lachnospiraceae bacterium]
MELEQPIRELRKLKREELLEIMMAQSKEIDSLRDRVEELQKETEQREIRINRAGSIAEASLSITKVFEEAQRTADLYLENIRRKAEETGAADIEGFAAENEPSEADGTEKTGEGSGEYFVLKIRKPAWFSKRHHSGKSGLKMPRFRRRERKLPHFRKPDWKLARIRLMRWLETITARRKHG